MRPGEQLFYGSPFPRGGVFEGVYIDDHLAGCIIAKSSLACRSGRDADIMSSSRAGYAADNLPTSGPKRFDFLTFCRLGHSS